MFDNIDNFDNFDNIAESNDLIELILKGKTHLYKRIILKYQRIVQRTIAGIIGCKADVEDVAQEVFIALYKALPGYKKKSSLKTYVVRIAINFSLNYLKKHKKKQDLDYEFSGLVKTENLDYTDNLASQEQELNYDRLIIDNALQKIALAYRQVLVLRLLDGLTVDETAKILKIPQGTVMSRLSRGQRMLKKILEPIYSPATLKHQKKGD